MNKSSEGALTEQMRQLAENYGNVWDAKAPEGLADRIFAPDIIDHNMQPGQGPGREGIKQLIALYHAVFPDLHLTNEDVIVSGDRAVLRWTATGTHEGDQLGVPATHRSVCMTGIDIIRIKNGQIVERWGETNGLELMQQIGAT
jgi:predicted ester cyclase